MAEEKTYVEDVDRSFYDFRYAENDAYRVESGLTPEIVAQISREKNDPDWMREFRLKSLEIYAKTPMVEWGPSIEGLDVDNIVTYIRPQKRMQKDWNDVPDDIKETFCLFCNHCNPIFRCRSNKRYKSHIILMA